MSYSNGESEELETENMFSKAESSNGYARTQANLAIITLTFLSGTTYVLTQWKRHGTIIDSLFVSMLIFGTIILVVGIRNFYRYLVNKGFEFFIYISSSVDPDKSYKEYLLLCNSVMNIRNMTIVGILYGLSVGTAPFLLRVWQSDITLKILLSVFLLTVNFSTGIAFYGLLNFFRSSFRIGRMVTIDLWRIDNPSTAFLSGATIRISVLASLYICICLSSIIFSLLPISGLVIAYGGFASLIILSSIIIPPLPIAQKIRAVKNEALNELDMQMQIAFQRALKGFRDDDTRLDLREFESLIRIRERIDAISPWPFKIQSITAGISIFFFSSIPVLLQVILERILD